MIKVGIADDEVNICRLIYNLIDWKSLDMNVIGMAHDGIAALELVKNHSPHLMITDIRMPGCDGLDFISKAKKINEDMDFIIISGYRDFEYAQTAIKYDVCDYLLKPINKKELIKTLEKICKKHDKKQIHLNNEQELEKRLKDDIQKIRQDFIKSILYNSDFYDTKTIETLNTQYNFNFNSGLFQIFAVKIDCGFSPENAAGIHIVKNKANSIILDIQEFCYDIELIFYKYTMYVLINYSSQNEKNVRKKLKTILDQLLMQKNIFTGYTFTIGLSNIETDLTNIKELINQAEQAIMQRIFYGGAKIYEYEQKQMIATVSIPNLNKIFENAIDVLNKKELINVVHEIKNKFISTVQGKAAFETVLHILNTYITILKQKNIRYDYKTMYNTFLDGALRCTDFNEIFENLCIMIENSFDKIIYEFEQADSKPIRIAKEYIKKNYMKSLNLEEVSAVAGFNASYFSSLFKKECSINFTEYITEVRMEKAKELLKETDLGIYAICIDIGYSDLKYFTKSFKKFTGVKPNEYRKLYN